METKKNTVISGDSVEVLNEMDDDSVDLVITSPPYYNQRDYEVDGQIGQEDSINNYIIEVGEVFEQCVRVVKPTGNIVFNVGDKRIDGDKKLVPYRFATQMQTEHDV